MAQLTRGQFAIELAEWMGLDTSKKGGFSDTNGTRADGAVTALKARGITTGIGGGKFGMNEPMTRAQAATMLGRAFNVETSSTAQFSDVPGSSYYAGYANAFSNLGIFGVNTGGTFRPDEALQSEHLDLVFSRMISAGFDPENPTNSRDVSRPDDIVSPLPPADEPPDVVTADERGPYITRDFLQSARDMLHDTFGIKITQEVDDFIRRAWREDWDEEDIRINMYGENFFNARFPAMKIRRDKGLAPISAEEYIQMESGYAEQLRSAGFPPSFYDSSEDFTNFLANDRSVLEVRDDIAAQFQRVNDAPDEVRQFFSDVFGADGEAALASFFLDPDRAAGILEEAASVAEIGGTGYRFGFSLSQERASRLAAIGVDLQRAQSGFLQLTELSSLFSETVGEDEDLTAEEEGTDLAFGVDGLGAKAIEKRRQKRVAAFSGDSAAAADESGVFGLGSAS